MKKKLRDMSHEEFLSWLEKKGACTGAKAWVAKHKHTPTSAFWACLDCCWLGWAMYVLFPRKKKFLDELTWIHNEERSAHEMRKFILKAKP